MFGLKAILLDLDETLFDHRHACRMGIRALRDTYEELQKKTVEELEHEFWVMLDRMYHDVLAGRTTAEASRLERLRVLFRGCGAELEDAALLERLPLYQQTYHVSRRAMPGAAELLDACRERGVRVAVLTNGLVEVQRDKVSACGLTDRFDHMITSQEAGAKKPDPLMFRLALERFGIAPDETVMIGDSWEADVLGAQAAGIRALWLNRGRMDCPDAALAQEIGSLEEALELLKLKG